MDLPAITPLLFYRDPRAALKFLEDAFGFETRLVVDDGQGGVIHSETTFAGGVLMVSGPPSGLWATPSEIGGQRTGSVHLQLSAGIDGHCERARAAGATIDREPADQPYGDRVYTCRDLEGHSWSFGQTLELLSAGDMAAATGRDIKATL
ncbi:MAG TPA: VOC family protein [Caulobacteraceae bacterium]|jgi:uncharacterized glyoxalase superfamily protein PhnB|nr:VOC family protein [Caulobacteraceae bacterium]